MVISGLNQRNEAASKGRITTGLQMCHMGMSEDGPSFARSSDFS